MPELVAITTAHEDASPHSIATHAVQEFEQYARKDKSPYWDVTAASASLNTVQKALGKEDVIEDDKSLLVFEITSPEASELLDDAFETTITKTQEQLQQMRDALDSVTGTNDGNTEGAELISPAVTDDPAQAEQLLTSDEFVLAAAEIGDRFGSIYRVFDLTNLNHGNPVRSRDTVEEIQSHYRNTRDSVFVVKLLARRR